MPRIPLYDGPQVRQNVQGAPQQSFQAQQDVSAQARQLGGALDNASGSLDRINLRNAQEAAFTAETEIKANWLQTDADLRKRFRGNNVEGYQEEVTKFWTDTAAKYGERLDPLARSLATRSLAQAQSQAQAGALRYYEGEKETAAVQSWESAKVVTKQMALTDGSLPAIEAARVDLARKNAQEAARRGLDSDALQALNLRDLTSLHSEFISTNAQARPEEMKAYFEKYKDEIDGTRHDTINKVLTAEVMNTTAKKTADSWASLPMDEQLVKLSEIKDPVLREKTQLFVKQNHALVKEAKAENERKYSDQAWQLVGAGKRVPEAVLSQMDGRERVQLQEFLRQRAEHQATVGNKPPKTDPKLHAELWDEMVRDPEAFKNRRLAPLAMQLSPQDLEQLAMQQKSLMNPKKEADFVKFQSKVTAQAAALGIKPKDVEKHGEFVRAAQMEFEAHQTRTGKPPTPKEEDEILDRLALPGKNSIFSGTRGQADTYAESVVTGKKFTPDISSADRDELVKRFKSNPNFIKSGLKEPTDDQVLQAYKTWKGIK